MGSIWTGKKCPAVAIYHSVAVSPTVKPLSNVDAATGWLEDFSMKSFNDFDKESLCLLKSWGLSRGEKINCIFLQWEYSLEERSMKSFHLQNPDAI